MFSEAMEAIYDESEKRGCFGICPYCEGDMFDDDDEEPHPSSYYEHVLCYICGVCFKYHHDDNFCDPIDPEPILP